ncbi:hypothetical protein [Pedobacter frigiditerrae]|uniref:hypothetical protein n=1 Tax=Pedobacter frigiditerrae TaxID=2530452 RepID=UPI002930B538|nr:hypothetical protein [Pedobacter frigiditerrae]
MKKVIFRFFFILFLLIISPWYFLNDIPGVSFLLDFYHKGEVWIVELFNKHLLHVKDTLNENGGGSGDTSFAWAQFYTFIILSALACIIWSLIDRKRKNDYLTLDFLLYNLVRYHLALVSFSYGIIKIFALQMPFPNLSQLATPLGDFLPMRLSWMFIGYSTTYQVFSGVMEIIVGVLLLNRKTVTLGALMGVVVFANVFMINLSYDVPVKLYSLQLLMNASFLIVMDWERLSSFFLLNKHITPAVFYDIHFKKKWQKIGRIVFKIVFVIVFVLLPFNNSWKRFKTQDENDQKAIKKGIYDIKAFTKNNQKVTNDDEMIWKDFIFDKGGSGSIKTTDTIFRQRYGRGYFIYSLDSVSKTIAFKKYASDQNDLFKLNYNIVDKQNLVLWGKVGSDSLRFELQMANKNFQLAERQFHWISEANR